MKLFFLNLFILLTCISTAQIAEKAEDIAPLLIGESVPNEVLKNSKNEDVAIKSILSNKKTIMVFYRGGWCPYCNVQLSELADAEKEFLKLGYQIVAISPESFENITSTTEADKLNYSVYADPKANFIQKVGIGFKMSEKSKAYISKKSKGELTEVLPVPTVFVLDSDGKILFEYINIDYSKRVSKELIMAALKAL